MWCGWPPTAPLHSIFIFGGKSEKLWADATTAALSREIVPRRSRLFGEACEAH